MAAPGKCTAAAQKLKQGGNIKENWISPFSLLNSELIQNSKYFKSIY